MMKQPYIFRVTIIVVVFCLNSAFAAKEEQKSNIEHIVIGEGSGRFTMTSAAGPLEKPIEVFFHKPKQFHSQSPILIVIPGAGRNGDDYRDSWVQASEQHGVLILSPSYSEDGFDFSQYHLGGIVKNFQVKGGIKSSISVYRLQDSDITWDLNNNPEDWIFQDFDIIFETAKLAVQSSVEKYDLFGHSAGGQILHRFALFNGPSKADRILASNSGFYTQVDLETSPIFGLKGFLVNNLGLDQVFHKNLVVFLGELDNEKETRGTTLHTPTVDRHGLGRFARGNYFYNEAQELALKLGLEFQWSMETILDTGHDYRLMGEAAARYLYE